MLIFTAVLKRRKSKSSQYQYLTQHAHEVKKRLGLRCWPVRSTYFERYRRAWQLFDAAIATPIEPPTVTHPLGDHGRMPIRTTDRLGARLVAPTARHQK